MCITLVSGKKQVTTFCVWYENIIKTKLFTLKKDNFKGIKTVFKNC